ncbi:MAG: proline dehydrogenase family protein [Actinomycetota bacterium]|nr:proline dehydrogenase family protein [Actinomycetota bacterium]
MFRQPLLMLSRSENLKHLISSMPISSGVVNRFVPGESVQAAVTATGELVAKGLHVTLDFLGEDTMDREQADGTADAYLELIAALSSHGLARNAETSLKLSALGQALPQDGDKVSLENARTICHSARNAGTTVTLDMEDHTTTDATLAALHELRKDFPETGAVVQSYLRRTEADCKELAYEGSRVRLCKGAYNEPESVAYQGKTEIDKSYVRCLKVLMAGQGYPMVATHDPRMVDIAGALATRFARTQGTYEYQMLYGIRPGEQRRLAELGEKVRVYLPYGSEWYGYLMRRLAERPSNLSFFLRSLASKK